MVITKFVEQYKEFIVDILQKFGIGIIGFVGCFYIYTDLISEFKEQNVNIRNTITEIQNQNKVNSEILKTIDIRIDLIERKINK